MVQYKGGYVKEPKSGIHRNIIVLDFRNLFPSIIITHKIGEKSGIPKKLEKILKKRWGLKRKIKKLKGKEKERAEKKQLQLKLVANIIYGKFAYSGSSHYNVKLAETIAKLGRKYIKNVIKESERSGFSVIYADTDSVFLTKGSIKKSKELVKKINKSLPGIIKLEYRGLYKKGLFVSKKDGKGAKKKYALLGKELLIKGFETQRGDWCNLAKKTQEKVLRLVLEGKTKKAVTFVKNVIKKRKFKYEDLIIRVQLAKPLSEYKLAGPHIFVAKKIKAKQGDVIEFVITKGSGRISDRAKYYKNSNLKEIDIDYYINKQLIPVALRVLSEFGVYEKDLYSYRSINKCD